MVTLEEYQKALKTIEKYKTQDKYLIDSGLDKIYIDKLKLSRRSVNCIIGFFYLKEINFREITILDFVKKLNNCTHWHLKTNFQKLLLMRNCGKRTQEEIYKAFLPYVDLKKL
jgi:hypothetical protein